MYTARLSNWKYSQQVQSRSNAIPIGLLRSKQQLGGKLDKTESYIVLSVFSLIVYARSTIIFTSS